YLKRRLSVDTGILKRLIKKALRREAAMIRRAALFPLESLRPEDGLPILLDLIEYDESHEVRKIAAGKLASRKEEFKNLPGFEQRIVRTIEADIHGKVPTARGLWRALDLLGGWSRFHGYEKEGDDLLQLNLIDALVASDRDRALQFLRRRLEHYF